MEENQYLDLIRNILLNGKIQETRNGRVKYIFVSMMRFNLQNNKIPILTTKQIAWKTCLKELLWFISGSTNNNDLIEQNVHIWDDNANLDFKTSIGKEYLPNSILGPIYGFQWRYFDGDYDIQTGKVRENGYMGIDQLETVIHQLKHDQNSRRIILTAWNPKQLSDMVLPPCHVMCQFDVHDNQLSCVLTQRSGDVGLGVPFNIASYSFLTHLLAKHCGLEPYEFIYVVNNAHIYENHIEQLSHQITLEPFDFPTIQITNQYENINDYKASDFIISNYQHHPKIIMKMVA
jgi:thymidylate synthase